MAEEKWQLSDGPGRTAFDTVVQSLKATAHALMRDKGINRSLLAEELNRDVDRYIADNRLDPSAASYIKAATLHASAEAWRENVQNSGRYTAPDSWFQQQQSRNQAWTRQQARQAADDAERDALKAAAEAVKAATPPPSGPPPLVLPGGRK